MTRHEIGKFFVSPLQSNLWWKLKWDVMISSCSTQLTINSTRWLGRQPPVPSSWPLFEPHVIPNKSPKQRKKKGASNHRQRKPKAPATKTSPILQIFSMELRQLMATRPLRRGRKKSSGSPSAMARHAARPSIWAYFLKLRSFNSSTPDMGGVGLMSLPLRVSTRGLPMVSDLLKLKRVKN